MRWTDEAVEAAIRDAMVRLKIDHMPTSVDLRSLEPDGNALACKIARSGGYDHWADRLGVPVSEHGTRFGWTWEQWFAEQAAAKGYEVERRGTLQFPADVKVQDHWVDVKATVATVIRGVPQWTWRINRKKHTCDVYAFVAVMGHDSTSPLRLLIVPANYVPLTTMTMSWGPKSLAARSRWFDNWLAFGRVRR